MPGRGTAPGEALYPECGTRDGVNRHRREKTRTCAGCREFWRQAMARYRVQQIVVGPRQVPTVGLKRRVRALATRGWGQGEIAGRLGLVEVNFRKVVQQEKVRREVHDSVKALYGQLWWREGPNLLAQKYALRKGWPGPLDWDDPDNPHEIPACEIERAHREALVIERRYRKNAGRRLDRRPALRVLEGGRQAGGQAEVQPLQKAVMAT